MWVGMEGRLQKHCCLVASFYQIVAPGPPGTHGVLVFAHQDDIAGMEGQGTRAEVVLLNGRKLLQQDA